MTIVSFNETSFIQRHCRI